jgi:hypothetical protein
MTAKLKFAAAAMSLLTSSNLAIADDQVQAFADMAALRDYCKATDEEHEKGYDESWEKNIADAPAELKALQADPVFEAQVEKLAKALVFRGVDPAANEELKATCAKILAAK